MLDGFVVILEAIIAEECDFLDTFLVYGQNINSQNDCEIFTYLMV